MRQENEHGQGETAARLQGGIAVPAALWMRGTAVAEGGGNDGAEENLETQKQVFQPSLGSLEISPTPPDFHIPTASAAASDFSNPYTEKREELATLERWKSKIGIPTFPPSQNACGARWKASQQPQERRHPAVVVRSHVQDHLALESKVDFRIILRLENAVSGR
jgi:hypothetical protein